MNMKKPIFAILVAAVMLAPALHAATYYWDNNGATANFGTASGTWLSTGTVGSGTEGWGTVSTGTTAPTGTITTGTADSINFGSSTASSMSTGTVTVSGTVNSGNITFGSGAGAIVLSGGTINLAPTQTITVNNATDTINSVLAGAATSFTKAGTGALILSGANTYTGATTISGGTLKVSGTGNLGGGSYAGNIANSGVFDYDSTANQTLSGIISGAGAVTKSGAGTLTLTGANTRTGMLTINAGTVSVTGAAQLGARTASITLADVAGAKLDLSGMTGGSRIIGSLSGGGTSGGNIVNHAGGIYFGDGASGDFDYKGIISGTGWMSYGGTAGTQTLSGMNTYTGSTTISKGTLSINSISNVNGGASSLGSVTSVTGGTIGIGSTTTTGTLLYTGSGHSTDRVVNLAGTTGGGTLDASGSGALVFSSALTATGAGAKTLTLTGTNTADNRIGGAIVNNSGANTTSLTKDGTGKWVLSGANTYTGATTISAGTLQIGSGGSTGSLSTSSALNNNGTLVFNRNNAITQGTDFASVIAGNGNVIQNGSGTLTLTGSNTYTGGTTVSAGTLLVNTGASIATSTSIVNGGLLRVNGTAGSVTVNGGGSLGGSGTVGALTLGSGGLLNPGNSPGTLTAASAIVLGGSTYNWQISALEGTAGTNWDLLSVTTLLDMSGVTSANKWNLVVTADGAFTGWTGTSEYSYVFAQAASVSGFSATVGTDVTDLFNITASGITSLPNASSNPNGDFKVVVGSAGDLTTLKLMAIPEPSTGSLLGFGLAGLVVTRLLRRRNS
jgi:autotransporter-associated beta strand protein